MSSGGGRAIPECAFRSKDSSRRQARLWHGACPPRLARRRSPQQDKIGLRVQTAQHSRIRLIEEFLAVVLVELGNFLHVSWIGERGKRHARRNDTHIHGKAPGG